jgi:hypothetical protein
VPGRCALIARLARGDATKRFRSARTASGKLRLPQIISDHVIDLIPSRKRLKCKYAETDEIRSPAPAPDQRWDDAIADTTPAESIDYPTLLFMDPALLQHGRYDASSPSVKIPTHVQDLIGNADQVRLTSEIYFARTHPWMPFVSKKRFYDIYMHQALSASPGLAFPSTETHNNVATC